MHAYLCHLAAANLSRMPTCKSRAIPSNGSEISMELQVVVGDCFVLLHVHVGLPGGRTWNGWSPRCPQLLRGGSALVRLHRHAHVGAQRGGGSGRGECQHTCGFRWCAGNHCSTRRRGATPDRGQVRSCGDDPPWQVRPGRRAVGRNSRSPQVGPGTLC